MPLRVYISSFSFACLLALLALASGLYYAGLVPVKKNQRQTVKASQGQMVAIQTHLLWSRYDKRDRERRLDLVRAAGVRMVRVDVGWASLEDQGKGKRNDWYLDRVDHVVRAAEARGIKILFTFWETPCWASTAPDHLKQDCKGAWWERDVQRYPPTRARDYGEALAFMVGRYGDRVAAWEIWNEPNHDDFFKTSNQVARYAALVKAAYPRAKSAHAKSTIIAGSLADSDFQFTKALLARGVGNHFDAWSVHPYSENRSPFHPGIAGWSKKSFAAGIPQVRKALLGAGQRKPIWLTEFGWSTCAVRGQAAWQNCVSPSLQARYIRQAFRKMRSWRYVRAGVVFNLKNTSSDRADRVDNYGLVRLDGSLKPAYRAVLHAARALRSR